MRILTYHAIGTRVVGDVRSMYTISAARFEEHVRHLATSHANSLVPLGCVMPSGNPLGIAVTFDDGYLDNLSIAAPLLSALRVPFTVFVCTGEVERRMPGFLGPTDLRELASMPGATIGSHTVDHPRLAEAGDSRLKLELERSKAYLEDLLGMEVDALSYPHGSVDRRVADAARNAGYRLGATSRFDINIEGRDPLLLCRTDIWADDCLGIFEQKLRGDWDWNRWRTADPDSHGSRCGILDGPQERGRS